MKQYSNLLDIENMSKQLGSLLEYGYICICLKLFVFLESLHNLSHLDEVLYREM